jgi:hypothetical protein
MDRAARGFTMPENVLYRCRADNTSSTKLLDSNGAAHPFGVPKTAAVVDK